jgi:hypothetical protein
MNIIQKLTVVIHVNEEGIGNCVDIYGGKDDGTVYEGGRGTIVQISKVTGKPMPWSEEAKNWMLVQEKRDKAAVNVHPERENSYFLLVKLSLPWPR